MTTEKTDKQPAPGGGSQLPPASGSEFAVFFQCKPGNHWRACTDTVTAETAEEAKAIIAATDYGMPTTGPYTPNSEVSDASDSFAAPLGCAVRSTTYKQSEEK